MRKHAVCNAAAIVFCSMALCLALPMGSLAADVSSHEESAADQYKSEGESTTEIHDGRAQTGTQFYLKIENPHYGSGGSSGSGSGGSSSGSGVSSSKAQSITYTNFPMSDDEELVEQMELESLAQQNGNLPKTGDYGPDKIVLFELALLFGTGYLVCDHYEKKHERFRQEKEKNSAL